MREANRDGTIILPMLLGFGMISASIFFLLLIISIVLAIIVYRDAESRGRNALLWAVVVLLIGIIGVIIYLIVRDMSITRTR